MLKTIFVIAATSSLLYATAAYSGNGNPPDFNQTWHGHGANHQSDQEKGATASDRHGFSNAPAGKSGHNPTDGSAQND